MSRFPTVLQVMPSAVLPHVTSRPPRAADTVPSCGVAHGGMINRMTVGTSAATASTQSPEELVERVIGTGDMFLRK
jgi:hypothetical protein